MWVLFFGKEVKRAERFGGFKLGKCDRMDFGLGAFTLHPINILRGMLLKSGTPHEMKFFPAACCSEASRGRGFQPRRKRTIG